MDFANFVGVFLGGFGDCSGVWCMDWLLLFMWLVLEFGSGAGLGCHFLIDVWS